MQDDLQRPVRLQYWSVDREARPEDAIEFLTLHDAVAFAMTQRPGNREIAWIRTADGEVLLPPRIMALWELRKRAA
ncbi:hypothetical protein ACUSIJ_13690 [Pseudochelatococcus sp. B33]